MANFDIECSNFLDDGESDPSNLRKKGIKAGLEKRDKGRTRIWRVLLTLTLSTT